MLRQGLSFQELRLEEARQRSLYRSPDAFFSRTSPKKLDRFVDFSSNDYLGLSHDARVSAAASRALKLWGAGSGASRLLSGNFELHLELERKLAHFKHEQAALVFSSGYLANIGAITTLADEHDVVLIDRLCHASLIDGARLSKAKLWVYGHRNVERLEALLSRSQSFRRRLVVTDGYFSMDGDLAPLPELAALCKQHDATLYVDEAHSTGVYGKTGRGLMEHFGLGPHPHIVVMGTLSKALGGIGGFVAGTRILRETLVNFCRPYIFTTAPSPAASAAAIEAISILEKTPGLLKQLRFHTAALRQRLKEQGFDLMGSEGPIVPVRVGDPAKAMRAKEKLKKRGFIVSAIRPPSVPEGTDRLRLSVSAAHTAEQIHALVEAFKKEKDSIL